jgi:hypothetical protein
MRTRIWIAFAILGVAVMASLIIFVDGKLTRAHKEVLHLHDAYCSAVAVRVGTADLLVTSQHCNVRSGDRIKQDRTYIGTTNSEVAACGGGLSLWTVSVNPRESLNAVAPSVADLVDDAPVRIVGYGYSGLRRKAYAVGLAADATCPDCKDPHSWEAVLTFGLACRGDSGGGAFTDTNGVFRLAGITESGRTSGGCTRRPLMHRLDAHVVSWMTDSWSRYQTDKRMVKSCP